MSSNAWDVLAVGGVAALAIGGACVLLSALQEDNKKKERDLVRARNKCEEDLRNANIKLEEAKRLTNAAARMAAKDAAFHARQEAADVAYQEYAREKEEARELYERIMAAEKEKRSLENQMKKLVEEAKESTGKSWINYRDFPEIENTLGMIRQFSEYLKSTRDTVKVYKANKDRLLEIVRENNALAKRAHDDAIETRRETYYLTCTKCGRRFPFTAGEAKFFDQRGFSYPKKCPSCRREGKIGNGRC